MSRWLAPPGYTIPQINVTIEPRIGGRYDYYMLESNGGKTSWFRKTIIELVKLKLLVLEFEPMPEHGFPEPVITRIELEAIGHVTILSFSRQYPVARRQSATATWDSSLTG